MTSSPKRPASKGKKPAGGEIIHVAFGPGGGRIETPKPAGGAWGAAKATADQRGDPAHSPVLPSRNGEPISDVFSLREVARLLACSPARLRRLEKAGVVVPSAQRGRRRAYTFQDLIALRATQGLLAHRIRISDVARAIDALRVALPKVTRPLQQLRVVSDGRRIVVQSDAGSFEPVTGQMVLDFRVEGLRDDVVRVLRPQTPGARARCAYDVYARASEIDNDPSRFDEAEALYQHAIELDPRLAIAYTNLGNIRFRRGDEPGAEQLYRKALAIDARQPEAHYNLGYVMLERGFAAKAASYFEAALESDPRFADAHFNLAMALEALAERHRARAHWRLYLELEPTGTWADIARNHL